MFFKSCAKGNIDSIDTTNPVELGNFSHLVSTEWKLHSDEEKFRWRDDSLNAGPYKCTKCERLFKRHNDGRYHEKSCGLEHECSICNKRFSSRKTLVTHNRSHTDDFMCTICQKKFTSKAHLKRHQEQHVDSKENCNICGGTFKNKNSLSSHVKKFHA